LSEAGRGRPKITPELERKVVRLYEEGYSTVQISKILQAEDGVKVTPQGLYSLLKHKHGIVRNRIEAQKLRWRK